MPRSSDRRGGDPRVTFAALRFRCWMHTCHEIYVDAGLPSPRSPWSRFGGACTRDPQKSGRGVRGQRRCLCRPKHRTTGAIDTSTRSGRAGVGGHSLQAARRCTKSRRTASTPTSEYARAGDLEPSNPDAHAAGRHAPAFRQASSKRHDPGGAGAEGRLPIVFLPTSCSGNALCGPERHGEGDQTDPAGHQPRSLVRAGLDGARRRAVSSAAPGRRGVSESGQTRRRDRSTRDWRTRQLRVGARRHRPPPEQTLQSGSEHRPAKRRDHRALALLYLSTRRLAQAEPHFKALASDRSDELALADYYAGVGDAMRPWRYSADPRGGAG